LPQQTLGKVRGVNTGGFREETRLVAVKRTSGHGVVFTWQIFVAKVGLRTQW
jgi:hypothetical protein